jgi:hypothetical protein
VSEPTRPPWSLPSDDAGDLAADGDHDAADGGGDAADGGGEPGERPPAGDRDRRGRNAVLGALAGLLLLCGIGGYAVARPYLAEHPATLTTPEQVAGLRLTDDPTVIEFAAQLSATLTDAATFDDVVAAAYRDEAAPDRAVIFLGGTRLQIRPERELEAWFEGYRAGSGDLTGLAAVDPGPLGGHAKCGTSVLEGLEMAVCGWADYGSLGIGLFPNRTTDEGADLLRSVRAEALSR